MKTEIPPPPSSPVPESFGNLTWEHLENWTDHRSIQRGKIYVGNVSDAVIAKGGRIVATVSGRSDYATEIRFDGSGELQGRCTCPVGSRCKHAVALVLKCIDMLGSGTELPIADDDDERLELLAEEYGLDEEPDESEADDDDGVSWTKDRPTSVGSPVGRGRRRDEISDYIDSLGETAAKKLLREIAAGRDDIRADLLRRIRTDCGDVARLLTMARKELKRLAREPAYVDSWKHEHCIPDYAPLGTILRKLFEKKAFDELVAFGSELREETSFQIQCADDDGETGQQICDCMQIVAGAVRHSSLSDGERLRWFCALHADDIYCAFEDIYDPFDNPTDWNASDWSDFADEMRASFESPRCERDGDEEESEFGEERRLRSICEALQNAGRADESRDMTIDWLKKRRKFYELAKFFLDEGDLDSAWKTAVDGLTCPDLHDTYGNTRNYLRGFLRELAGKRGDARLSLSIQAEIFFDRPSNEGFFDLIDTAKKERLSDAIRPWLVRFLETGLRPDGPGVAADGPASPRKRGRAPKAPARASSNRSNPGPSVPWPLAPSGLPCPGRPPRNVSREDILLEIALREKNPNDVLRRWKAFDSAKRPTAWSCRWDGRSDLAEAVADALSGAYPAESLRIWDDFVNRELASPYQSSYDAIAERFRKARPVMEKLGRLEEWENRIRSLCMEYKRRKNFVKALSSLVDPPAPSPTILQTRKS